MQLFPPNGSPVFPKMLIMPTIALRADHELDSLKYAVRVTVRHTGD